MPSPASPASAGDGHEGDQPTAPPSFTRQMAQLVIIPALIVVAVLAVMGLFAVMAGQQDSIEDQLNRLRQSSGQGRLPMGLQDPRYKDRSLAAHNLAAMLPTIKDPAERARISRELVDILDRHIDPTETELVAFTVLAIGQLGEEGGLDAILARRDASQPGVRRAVAEACANWPDRPEARRGIPILIDYLIDDSPQVATVSATALGALAQPDDAQVVASLREAMGTSDPARRDVRWNAAVALARLGDSRASQFVAGLLLDRQALAQTNQITADGAMTHRTLTPAVQDKVILSTLAAAGSMTDSVIWGKIGELAENDPNMTVRKAAQGLLQQYEQ